MNRSRLGLLTAAVLTLAYPALAQTPAAPPAQSDTKIAVLSTGTGPKRPLRYKIAAGAKERIDMKMEMGVSIELPGMGQQSMPAAIINMGVDMDVTSVAPNGDVALTMTVSSASMEGAGMPGGALDALKGIAASMTIDSRGIVKDLKFDDSKLTDPMMKQMISTSGLDRLSSPLPEEPMGVGGRWQVTQAVNANGIKLDQVSVFEVTQITDTSATFAMTITQSAPPQTIAPPGMPPGIEASLQGMSGSGSGKMTLTDGTLAMFGDMNMKSTITMDVNAQGQSQRVSTSTDLKMTSARGKRQ
jgi:hypothetical protein